MFSLWRALVMFGRPASSEECDQHAPGGICSNCFANVNAGMAPSHSPALLDDQKEFIRSLIDIGLGLRSVMLKEARSKRLMHELCRLNERLPHRLWLPIYNEPHVIVRIPCADGCVLNSKEKAPYCIFVEVLDVENIETAVLPSKGLDPELSVNRLGTSSRSAPANLDIVCNEDNEDESGTFAVTSMASRSEEDGANGCIIDQPSSISGITMAALSDRKCGSDEANCDSVEDGISAETSDNGNSVQRPTQPTAKNDEADEELQTYTSFNAPAEQKEGEVEISSGTESEGGNEGRRNSTSRNARDRRETASSPSPERDNAELRRQRKLIRHAKRRHQRQQRIEDLAGDPSASTMSEPWDEKVARLRAISPYGHLPNWRLTAVIVKAGDDLNLENLASRFLQTLQDIWDEEKVKLCLRPYRIFVLSKDAGLIEPIPNACSIHQIRLNMVANPRKDDAGQEYPPTLLNYFLSSYGSRLAPKFIAAQKNFLRSCAAYCLACYFLQVKDRHNGNILIDHNGYLIHIDFGYILSITPCNLGFETSPFKLTHELIEVMNGLQSDTFAHFKHLMTLGLSTARKHRARLISIVEEFINRRSVANLTQYTLKQLEDRFVTNLSDEELKKHVDVMVKQSRESLTTRAYDTYQYVSNRIL